MAVLAEVLLAWAQNHRLNRVRAASLEVHRKLASAASRRTFALPSAAAVSCSAVATPVWARARRTAVVPS